MNTLKQKLDDDFDPTDSDRAARLAYRALKLLQVCERVLFANASGMRVGRDDSIELSVRMNEVAEALHLIPYQADGRASVDFHRQLAREAGLPATREE